MMPWFRGQEVVLVDSHVACRARRLLQRCEHQEPGKPDSCMLTVEGCTHTVSLVLSAPRPNPRHAMRPTGHHRTHTLAPVWCQCQRPCPPLESERCLRQSLQSQGTTENTPSRLSGVNAPRSKTKHVLVRQRLSPEARCPVAASCRQLQGRIGACRAPLRAVTRSDGASLLRRDVAEGCARERGNVQGTLVRIETARCDKSQTRRGDANAERAVWHLVTASRLETAET